MRSIWQRMIRHRRRRRGKHDGGLLFRSPTHVVKRVWGRRERSVEMIRLHAVNARGGYSITTIRRRLTLERGGARRYYFVVNGQEQIPRTPCGYPDIFDVIYAPLRGASSR